MIETVPNVQRDVIFENTVDQKQEKNCTASTQAFCFGKVFVWQKPTYCPFKFNCVPQKGAEVKSETVV